MKNRRMKIARMEKDLNQEALAKLVGVTRQTILAIENGHYSPTLELAFEIAKVFELPLEQIFSLQEEEE